MTDISRGPKGNKPANQLIPFDRNVPLRSAMHEAKKLGVDIQDYFKISNFAYRFFIKSGHFTTDTNSKDIRYDITVLDNATQDSMMVGEFIPKVFLVQLFLNGTKTGVAFNIDETGIAYIGSGTEELMVDLDEDSN
jgi:hypothetical protein